LIAVILAIASIAIGVAVGIGWEARMFLWLAVYLNVVYWVVGQGFGGLATGSATDVNAAPLFILLACALYSILPRSDRAG
jgi:uncharacterized membrane protein YphA (DoxX/SURF4 family)